MPEYFRRKGSIDMPSFSCACCAVEAAAMAAPMGVRARVRPAGYMGPPTASAGRVNVNLAAAFNTRWANCPEHPAGVIVADSGTYSAQRVIN
jgi:hypothetical protein